MRDQPTPETDAMRKQTWKSPQPPTSPIPGDFAKKLERERDEARSERDTWRNHAERFAAILSDETPLATIGTDVVEALEKFRSLKEESK